jgi:hypothetical protein
MILTHLFLMGFFYSNGSVATVSGPSLGVTSEVSLGVGASSEVLLEIGKDSETSIEVGVG